MNQELQRALFSHSIRRMKTCLRLFLLAVIAANLLGCATPEERQRRDAERRREDARWEAEQRRRDREDARHDREYEDRYGRGYGWGRHYWY